MIYNSWAYKIYFSSLTVCFISILKASSQFLDDTVSFNAYCTVNACENMSFLVVLDSADDLLCFKTLKLRIETHSLDHLKMQIRQKFETVDKETTEFKIEIFDSKTNHFIPLDNIRNLRKLSRLQVKRLVEVQNSSTISNRALPWKKFPLNFLDGEFKVLNTSVRIDQRGDAMQGTGLSIWDGSVVLAKYLEHQHPNLVRGKKILELGSGTGIVGIVSGILGASPVVLTDLSYTIPLMKHNIGLNQQLLAGVEVLCRELDWFEEYESFGDYDYILASDVVWVQDLIDPLVLSMRRICLHSGKPTKIIMSYQSRSALADNHLFQSLNNASLMAQEIAPADYHPIFQCSLIKIYEIRCLDC